MFKWHYESSIEVDAPLQAVWDFYNTPNNWSKWLDELEPINFDGELKTGSQIKVTPKGKKSKFCFLVTDLKPRQEFKILLEAPLCAQETLSIFQEISPSRTRIHSKICVISILVPFIRSYLLKKSKNSYSKMETCLQQIQEKAVK